VPTVVKSGSLDILETSGLVQACNGIALPPLLAVAISHTQFENIRWYVDGNTYVGCVALRTFRVDELHGGEKVARYRLSQRSPNFVNAEP